MIVRRTREAHEEIARVIDRVQYGDSFTETFEGDGFGGGGLGGSIGIGGGFFSKP